MQVRAAVLIASLYMTVPAFADDLFTLTNGHDTITFELPASPDASARAGFAFGVNDVPVTVNGVTYDDSILVFDGMSGGGLNISSLEPNALLLYAPGVQLYSDGLYPITSTLFAPTFSLGSFQLRDGGIGFEIYPGAYNIEIAAAGPTLSTAVTPEPSSLFLVLTGLIAAAMMFTARSELPKRTRL